MRVITKKRIEGFQKKFSDSVASLDAWYRTVKAARWRNFAELRQDFPSADQAGRRTVFNIALNRYRLIARINYKGQRVYVLAILTHKEYDREKLKK